MFPITPPCRDQGVEWLIAEICSIIDGPVSAEVASTQSEGMIKEGERLAKIGANVVIKLPLILEV